MRFVPQRILRPYAIYYRFTDTELTIRSSTLPTAPAT